MSDLPKGETGFDRRDVQKCALCGKGMAHDGAIVFYEIKIAQVVLDHNAIRQQLGLEIAMGHPGIAAVLAPTTRVGARLPADTVLVCYRCFMDGDRNMVLMRLLEAGQAAPKEDNGQQKEDQT
jgi:hypothetical protein